MEKKLTIVIQLTITVLIFLSNIIGFTAFIADQLALWIIDSVITPLILSITIFFVILIIKDIKYALKISVGCIIQIILLKLISVGTIIFTVIICYNIYTTNDFVLPWILMAILPMIYFSYIAISFLVTIILNGIYLSSIEIKNRF